MPVSRWSLPTVLSAAGLLAPLQLCAVDAGPIPIHGAVSTTASYSDHYNFLGDTKGSPKINSVEAILNGAHRFDSGLTVAAQLYAYEVDNYSDVTLDYATLAYPFNEKIGVRLGRVKWAAGLYGDLQDIDMVRPFAYLPLGFYQKTLRPITASYDGLSLHGSLGLGAAGSLDYQVGYGYTPPVAPDSAYLRTAMQSSLNTVDRFDGDTVSAAWLFWNLPVDGLRVGYSRNTAYDFSVHGEMKTAAEIARAPGTARLTPLAFPPGVWDLMVAGRPASLHGDYTREYWSAEYERGAWVFAAEYQRGTSETVINYAAPIGRQVSQTTADNYYGMVTWQASDRWQFGGYYAESFANKDDRSGRSVMGVPRHTAWMKDAAVAASYAATDWWLIKAEVHRLDGTLGVPAYNNSDAAGWRQHWSYFVLKTTLSF